MCQHYDATFNFFSEIGLNLWCEPISAHVQILYFVQLISLTSYGHLSSVAAVSVGKKYIRKPSLGRLRSRVKFNKPSLAWRVKTTARGTMVRGINRVSPPAPFVYDSFLGEKMEVLAMEEGSTSASQSKLQAWAWRHQRSIGQNVDLNLVVTGQKQEKQ